MDLLKRTLVTQEIRLITDKREVMNLKSFFYSKRKSWMKKQPAACERIFASVQLTED